METDVEERSLDDFTQLLDLLLASTDIGIGNVRLLLYLHHRDGGVDTRGKRDLNLVVGSIDTIARGGEFLS